MTNRTIIHKLLHFILVEIRIEAYSIENAKIFHLADLFHNIPLQLEQRHEEDNYDDILEWLTTRAGEKNFGEWLKREINYIKTLPSSLHDFEE